MNEVLQGCGQRRARSLGLACLLGALGCSGDDLAQNLARIQITPLPSPGQVVLESPVGIDYGPVAIKGLRTAAFEIENVSTAFLELQDLRVVSQEGAVFTPALFYRGAAAALPLTLNSIGTEGSTARLEVTVSPLGPQGALAAARIALGTNAGAQDGAPTGEDAELQLRATAVLLGDGNLELLVGDHTYRLPQDCASQDDGTCTLPPADFGKVTLGSHATPIPLALRNAPAAGTCELADPSGAPDCSPVCILTFQPDPQGNNLGIGFVGDPRFALAGFEAGDDLNEQIATRLPFRLAPPKSGCASTQQVVRGEQQFALTFQAGAEPTEHTGVLVLESDDPDAPRVALPLLASSREGPTAVAKLRACGADDPPPTCTDEESIQPQARVYLDGRDSFDVNGLAITDFRWSLAEVPGGAHSTMSVYAPDPALADGPLFSFVPLAAGRYTLRLRVTNEDGVHSGLSSTSDVTVEVKPLSNLHVQLLWAHPSNDQDVHLTKVDEEGVDRVYHVSDDCFWGNCRPACLQDNTCDSARFTSVDEPGEGGNPRLDLDAQNGVGPENINIDAPEPGSTYRVYVHYYGLTQVESTPTEVIVRIFINGVLQKESRRTLFRNDLWAVAQIEWASDDEVTIRSPSSTTVPVQTLDTLPAWNEGYTFSPSPF